MSTTLVLNADALPVSVVPLSTVYWQKAIKIIYKERATVISEYSRWVIRSPSVEMRMPSIIMLTEYQVHNGKVEFSRYNVVLRDNSCCLYCGETFPVHALTFDHVVPRRDGGKTEWTNIVSACNKCNQEKAHHHRMKPRKAPHHPTYWELAANRKKHPIVVPHESWLSWINWGGKVTIDPSLRNVNCSESEVIDSDGNLI